MKPTTPVLRRGEYLVRDIPLALARELVTTHHYSKGGSTARVYTHGLFARNSDECLGVAWWIPPTKPAAESAVRGDWSRVHSDHFDRWRGVLALTRLVIVPGMPTNSATFLLGQSIKMIGRERAWHTLLTYADEGEGHTGAIYRATNWQYLGAMRGHPSWRDAAGHHVAIKSTINRTYAQMRALGLEQRSGTSKHKFVMRLT